MGKKRRGKREVVLQPTRVEREKKEGERAKPKVVGKKKRCRSSFLCGKKGSRTSVLGEEKRKREVIRVPVGERKKKKNDKSNPTPLFCKKYFELLAGKGERMSFTFRLRKKERKKKSGKGHRFQCALQLRVRKE